ncbi:hypothetical protein [Micromonospora sp. NPDC023888]|uniref:MmyB family transcriptional regulator n=1 Tax=Micromonospora sp. NPDC023888 TaxID=3155607 RepID=UPI0033C964F1
MRTAGPLGEYLRARRELIRPGDVGLPAHGRRRVPGLRREELSAGSERFRRLWARHDVVARAGGGVRVFRHPRVGELKLRYEKLTIAGTTQSLVVYHAEPGSPSARALARLARHAAAGVPDPAGSRLR